MSEIYYFRNGKIWTGDELKPNAGSVLICGDKIYAVGETSELDKLPEARNAVVIDLNGVTVVPGFSDCHIHVLTSAKAMHSVDTSTATSLDDVLSMLRERSACISADEWIYATMLNETGWKKSKLPVAKDIDTAQIPNPVLIHRVCTHATIANSRALRLAGINELRCENIERDSNGVPTGILYDDAQLPAYECLKKALYQRSTLLKYLEEYLKKASSFGLTTLHTCSATSLGMGEDLGLYRELYENGKLSCRVYATHDELSSPPMGPRMGNDFVRFEGFKLFIDGAIGSRTAATSKPYHDDPGTTGLLLHEFNELCEKLTEATNRQDHILIHAIGDRAIAQELEAIEKITHEGVSPQHPYLLNHVEICPQELINRMSKLPVACVIQPTYVPSDIDLVPERLGEMEKCACNWKDFLDAGILLCGSSDNPIENLNPMVGIWALVNRTSWDGKRTWHEPQKLSLDEALHIYTTFPAKVYSTWEWNGSIKVGKTADFAILDRDIFAIKESELINTKVAMTVLNGQIVTRNNKF